MRIKIEGEVTAERLAAALRTALAKCEQVSPGTRFFNANLYLIPYDQEGNAFEMHNAEGDPMMITQKTPPGYLDKPTVTAAGEARRLERVALREQRRQSEDEAYRQRCEAMQRERANQDAEFAVALKTRQALELITGHCLEAWPEAFIEQLNGVVSTVWETLEPRVPHGQKKGQLLAKPVYGLGKCGFEITSSTMKNPKYLTNPLLTPGPATITSLWSNAGWREVEEQIMVLMDRFAEQLTSESRLPEPDAEALPG